VVPSGIEVPSPLPKVTKQPGRFTVLYLGNLVREKGVFVILKRFRWCGPVVPKPISCSPARGGPKKTARKRHASSRSAVCLRAWNSPGTVTGDRKWEIVAQSDVLLFPTYFR